MHQGQGQPSGRLPCLRGMGSVPRGRLSLSSSFLHRPGACMLNRRQADLSLGCQSSVRQAVPQLLLPAGQVASMTNRGIQLLLCVERKTAGCPSAPSSCKAHKQGRGKKPFRARCAGCCHGSGSIHGLARLQPPAILLPRCISTDIHWPCSLLAGELLQDHGRPAGIVFQLAPAVHVGVRTRQDGGDTLDSCSLWL